VLERRRIRIAAGLGLLIIVTAAIALRFGTNVLEEAPTFDEPMICGPIRDLIERGWSIKTAIDFEETKGPAMIWPYALIGGVLGGTLNDLRLVSVVSFVLAGAGVLWLALSCPRLRGPPLIAVSVLYVLLPYHAPLAQLVMSEASFVLGSVCLIIAFVWGFGHTREGERRIAGPLIYGLLLAVLLHHRIHAVAFAGAACLIALERDGLRSWPWWVASVAAGMLRIPLWVHWGGLVSASYQEYHGLGISPEAVVYLLAGLVPLLAVLLWPVLTDRAHRPLRWLVWVGVAAPSLAEQVPYRNDTMMPRFLGFISTGVRTISENSTVQRVMLSALAAVGGASLGALAALAWREPLTVRTALFARFTAWSLLAGCLLYGLTAGGVFDRYLLPWAVLLPIVWVAYVPRRVLVVQALMLAAVAAYLSWVWLIRDGGGA
jgi:hypothetical protein